MYFRLQKVTRDPYARDLSPMTGALGPVRGFWAKTHLHSTTWRGLKQCDLVPAESWGPGHGAAP